MCSAKGFRGNAGSLADLHEMQAKYPHPWMSIAMEWGPNEEGLDPKVFGPVPHWAENEAEDRNDYFGPYPMVWHLDGRNEYRDYVDHYEDRSFEDAVYPRHCSALEECLDFDLYS